MQGKDFTGVNVEVHLIFYFIGGYQHHIYDTNDYCRSLYDAWLEVMKGKRSSLLLENTFKGLPTAVDLGSAFRAEMLPVE